MANCFLEYIPHFPVAQAFDTNTNIAHYEANVCLIRCSLLGCSPLHPTIVVTLPTLELYHQLHRRHSSFSIQSMVKVLCTLQNVSVIFL